MNKFPPELTKEAQKRMLDNFASATFFHDKMIVDMFAMKERENREKFNKIAVVIPWYLKPFSKVITNIAYLSFKDGLSENCTDTVIFRRPNPFKGENDD